MQLQCQIAYNAPPTLPVQDVILQITSGPMEQAAAKLVVSRDARHVPALQPVRFVIQRTISFSVAEILAPSAHLVSVLTVRILLHVRLATRPIASISIRPIMSVSHAHSSDVQFALH